MTLNKPVEGELSAGDSMTLGEKFARKFAADIASQPQKNPLPEDQIIALGEFMDRWLKTSKHLL